MSAIESCRTAVLGGHVAACEKCGHTYIAYNSCRNRHFGPCQMVGNAPNAKARWLKSVWSRSLMGWINCRPGFFLPVRVLSRLFRRLFLEKLVAAQEAGCLRFFGDLRHLGETQACAGHLRPLRKVEWVVYAKRPFAGPQAVLAYLSRYTHRVAIANSRLISLDEGNVTFKWKDYRAKGRMRQKVMTLEVDEFIRRFLIHVLPSGFHRIRYYGLFANGGRAKNLVRARQLLKVPAPPVEPEATAGSDEPPMLAQPCPCCGGPMVIIETFERGAQPRAPPSPTNRGKGA